MSSKSDHAESFSILGCFKRQFKKAGQLDPPSEVEKVFHKYAEGDVMTVEKFKQFLMGVQGETNVTSEDAQKVMDAQLAHERHLLGRAKQGLSRDSFFAYLVNTDANGPLNNKVHHDMTLSASHYYVYTGHNSYLTGNQLSSDCSEVPIIEALNKGVRVIELDLWPNKKDKTQISVLHGNTMTSPVPFETCIVAIRDNAFKASEYPVVITFEDHLSPELQAKAAEITTRVLGKLLHIPHSEEKFAEFLSPEALKRKILISTKPPKEYMKGNSGKPLTGGAGADVGKVAEKVENMTVKKGQQKPAFDWGEDLPDFASSEHRANLSNAPVEDESEEEEDDVDEDGAADHATHPEYKRIISIRAGKPKGKSLVSALVIEQSVKRVSLSEPQLEKVAEEKPSALIEFTQRNMLRIYPYGLRLDSSNYNPLVAWAHGAQMVAFNMQGYGRPLWLVQGFFRANGGCGYVKKPDFLFPSEQPGSNAKGNVFDPREKQPLKVTLKVKVLTGMGWLEKFGKRHFDNFSPPDFYVRLGIAGLPADTVMKKTAVIEDDWLPNWEADFDFPLTVPELALLRIEVHEYDMTDKDDFGGQNCLPVSELKPGFRAIPLYGKKGRLYEGCRLLFHFELVPASA